MVKQPFFNVKNWNHPIETTIYKQMFQVPGETNMSHLCWWFQIQLPSQEVDHISPDPGSGTFEVDDDDMSFRLFPWWDM